MLEVRSCIGLIPDRATAPNGFFNGQLFEERAIFIRSDVKVFGAVRSGYYRVL